MRLSLMPASSALMGMSTGHIVQRFMGAARYAASVHSQQVTQFILEVEQPIGVCLHPQYVCDNPVLDRT